MAKFVLFHGVLELNAQRGICTDVDKGGDEYIFMKRGL